MQPFSALKYECKALTGVFFLSVNLLIDFLINEYNSKLLILFNQRYEMYDHIKQIKAGHTQNLK